jgi:ABC-type spermidine/putrescine transport system permease subunit I
MLVEPKSLRPWNDKELLVEILPGTLLQVLFFAVPLLMLILLSFQVSKQFLLVWSWDLETWQTILTRSHYWITLLRTALTAMATVALCLIIGFPVAYALAVRLPTYENHIKILIIFAFLTDAVLKTYGWVLLLDQNGIVNVALRSTGFVSDDFDLGLIFTHGATIIGMTYNLLPFTIFTIYLSVIAIDRDLLLAAYDAGSSKLQAFRSITLPLCRPGIWAGAVFVFILSMGALLEERILGGGTSPMMGALIRQTFETRVNWPLGAALTIVLVVTTIALVLLFSRLYLRTRGAPA